MTQQFGVSQSEIDGRISSIQTALVEKGMEGLFIAQRVDLFYFTGTSQSGYLYIPAEGEPILMIKRYWPRAVAESPIKNILEIKSIKEVPDIIAGAFGRMPRVIGFEMDVIPVREFHFYQNLFRDPVCKDASPMIHGVRMIKSPWEVERLEQTALLSSQTFEYIETHLREGYSEMEFAGIFEAFARKLGHGGMLRVRDHLTEGYPWHILSGRSGGLLGVLNSPSSGEGTSAAFPCGAGWKKIAAGEPILVDFNSVLNGYHFDETRMFAIGGMPAKAMDACHAAIEIHDEVLRRVKPGVTCDHLFQVSVAKAESLGYAEPYLGPPGYKVRFIGHGIGLELIEPPMIAAKRQDILQAGMVFALEPKMVFENEFAAGIESVFLVTESGHRLISKTPVKVFVC
jgi:Xaa-Pro dipeptidase